MPVEPPPNDDSRHLTNARRNAVTKKVRKYLDAPAAGGERPPILNFTETCGSGNTAVLDHLEKELKGKAPLAKVNCSRYQDEDPLGLPALLAEVKRKLSQQCEGYPRRQFRRLELGLAALKKPIDCTSQAAADQKVKVLVRESARPRRAEDPLPRLLQQLPAGLARATAHVIYLLVNRFPPRYGFYLWYGELDQNLEEPPNQTLQNLNQWQYGPEPSHGERDELLIGALLADVRSAYSSRPLSKDSWYSSVVLLRDADSPTGRALLDGLHERRGLLADGVRAEALLVVAGSHHHIEGCVRDEPVDEDGS